MKILFFAGILGILSVGFSSCSKCYECVEIQDVYDTNGNLIDQYEVREEICTASGSEIEEKESNGAVCS